MATDDNGTKLQKLIKWVADRLISAIALLFFSPLLLIIAIALYIRMGSPILFTQSRSGKDGSIFTLYKFRTMTDARNFEGNLLPDEQRLTVLGKFLRRTKLDELPQLWNVLKSDMSIVGPRPTLPQQVQDYDHFQRRRLLVPPGLSGWAQVNGNIQLSWPERICLDVWYIDHWSLWLDLVILSKTVAVVFWGEHPSQKALEEAHRYAKYTSWSS